MQTEESSKSEQERVLLERIETLEQRLAVLEGKLSNQTPAGQTAGSIGAQPGPAQTAPSQTASPEQVAQQQKATLSPSGSPLNLSDGTTLNLNFDGYYAYNFNHPVGRVNLLRANDVTGTTSQSTKSA